MVGSQTILSGGSPSLFGKTRQALLALLYSRTDEEHLQEGLIQLALHAEHLILSTRTASRLQDGTDISGSPLAYLLAHRESNNDPTNYWIFSPEGLKRCLARSGWLIRNTVVYGPEDGDPAEKDQRTFVYCQRVPGFGKLLPHHGV